ncbi:DUF86 domain-containing protein [Candidatus Calescamantes bacterium]|nr:DUF86 domain-containing protein [Candidatus Calescamantes bacterium]
MESKKGVPYKKFERSWELQNAILKEFETGIECIIDISSHIISEKGWRSPEKASDIANILEEKGVISSEYKNVLKRMVAFRNIIVHEYLYLDLKKVYENLKKLDDFRKFAFFIKKFLDKEKTESKR